MFDERHTGYPVVRNDDLVGMVTLEDAADVDETDQDAYRVEDVMSTDIQTVTAEADAMEVLQRMQQHDVGRLPVVDSTGNLVGIISRTDLMGAFSVIQEGGVPQRLRPPRPTLTSDNQTSSA
jgi:CBS domain-containing protein